MRLAGTTALVTGASGGIGEQVARRLAEEGVGRLVLVARRRERLESLAAELRSTSPGLRTDVLVADLADPAGPRQVLEALERAGTTVDLLVNNAGVGAYGAFASQDPAVLQRLVQLNCGSLVALARSLVAPMVERGRGCVLNVASTAAFQPTPTMAAYGASKAFVLSFTEALAVEVRRSGVQVVALCPGPTSTDWFAGSSATEDFLTRGRASASSVARAAVEAIASPRRTVVVPGAVNRTLAQLNRFLPRAAVARMAGIRVSRG